MKKMKTQIVLAAIMSAMIGFAGCSPAPDVYRGPMFPLHEIEIRNVPFTTDIDAQYYATPESIGFFVVSTGGRSGFAVARGYFGNGSWGPAIGPRVPYNKYPGEHPENYFNIVTPLYNLGGSFPEMFFQSVQRQPYPDRVEFDNELAALMGTAYVRSYGSVSIMYVTIDQQIRDEGTGIPPHSRGRWNVNFTDESPNIMIDEENNRRRLVLYWDEIQ